MIVGIKRQFASKGHRMALTQRQSESESLRQHVHLGERLVDQMLCILRQARTRILNHKQDMGAGMHHAHHDMLLVRVQGGVIQQLAECASQIHAVGQNIQGVWHRGLEADQHTRIVRLRIADALACDLVARQLVLSLAFLRNQM